MGLFKSPREKRLWIWTIALIATIFATLGFASTLAGILRDRALIDAAFLFSLFLIGIAVIAFGLKLRWGKVEFGVILGVFAVYLVVFARMAIPEERSHLIEYGVLALFILEALKERAANGGKVFSPLVLAFLLTISVGILDELIQIFLPNRVFDPFDMLFNALAAVMAIGSRTLLNYARIRWGKGRD